MRSGRLGVAECIQWRLRRAPLGLEDWRKIATRTPDRCSRSALVLATVAAVTPLRRAARVPVSWLRQRWRRTQRERPWRRPRGPARRDSDFPRRTGDPRSGHRQDFLQAGSEPVGSRGAGPRRSQPSCRKPNPGSTRLQSRRATKCVCSRLIPRRCWLWWNRRASSVHARCQHAALLIGAALRPRRRAQARPRLTALRAINGPSSFSGFWDGENLCCRTLLSRVILSAVWKYDYCGIGRARAQHLQRSARPWLPRPVIGTFIDAVQCKGSPVTDLLQ